MNIDLFNPHMIAIKQRRGDFPPIQLMTDAGHGWETIGKRSFDGSLRENDYNTSVERKIGMLVHVAKQAGVDIVHSLLSPEHYDISLDKRVDRERSIYAANHRDRLVLGISIHADAFGDPSPNGTTTFHCRNSQSKLFAKEVHDALLSVNGLRDRGVRVANFKILRETSAPWILVEAAFMTNEMEKEKLKTEYFRNINALSLFNSVFTTAEKYHNVYRK